MYLLILQIILQITGIICLFMSYNRRKKEVPFLSWHGSWMPAHVKSRFKDEIGYWMYIAGVSMLSLGGAAGTIYWFFVK